MGCRLRPLSLVGVDTVKSASVPSPALYPRCVPAIHLHSSCLGPSLQLLCHARVLGVRTLWAWRCRPCEGCWMRTLCRPESAGLAKLPGECKDAVCMYTSGLQTQAMRRHWARALGACTLRPGIHGPCEITGCSHAVGWDLCEGAWCAHILDLETQAVQEHWVRLLGAHSLQARSPRPCESAG